MFLLAALGLCCCMPVSLVGVWGLFVVVVWVTQDTPMQCGRGLHRGVDTWGGSHWGHLGSWLPQGGLPFLLLLQWITESFWFILCPVFSHVCVCVLSCFSCVRLFVTLWTVAPQAPLSMEFFRQEYWSELPCPPPRDLPNPGIKPVSFMSPALAGILFTTGTTWKAPSHMWPHLKSDIFFWKEVWRLWRKAWGPHT